VNGFENDETNVTKLMYSTHYSFRGRGVAMIGRNAKLSLGTPAQLKTSHILRSGRKRLADQAA
jgi:hypothetical protein